MEKEGQLFKRSMIGTVDIFQQINSKKNNTNTHKKVIYNQLYGTSLLTPQSRFQRLKSTYQETNGSSKNISKKHSIPAIPITDYEIDEIFIKLQKKIDNNQEINNKETQSLPFRIQLSESKPQRILASYHHVKNYWENKKEQLVIKSGKDKLEQGLLHATDDFRRKVEESEIIEKQNAPQQTHGGIIWRTSLRFYKQDTNYKINNSKKIILKGEQLKKKLAQDNQDEAERKEATKTYLFLDSFKQSPDITSIYLEKTFKQTEVVRTPNFNIYNALSLDLTKDNSKNMHMREEDLYIRTEDTEQDLIQDEKDNFEESQGLNTLSTHNTLSYGIRDKNRSSLTMSCLGQSQSMLSFKKMRDSEILLQKTIDDYKKHNTTLISQANEEDLNYLFIIGESKLKLEYESAKRIPFPKYLYLKDNQMDEPLNKEEIIEIDYDGKVFY